MSQETNPCLDYHPIVAVFIVVIYSVNCPKIIITYYSMMVRNIWLLLVSRIFMLLRSETGKRAGLLDEEFVLYIQFVLDRRKLCEL